MAQTVHDLSLVSCAHPLIVPWDLGSGKVVVCGFKEEL